MSELPASRPGVMLSGFTTLRVGGPADQLVVARNLQDLKAVVTHCQVEGIELTVLGWGSNVVPSPRGLRGVTVINQADELEFLAEGEVVASTGISFQEIFLKSAQRSLSGLEFAVGIPGTLGGALVSNAGAYRSGISALVTEVEVVSDGEARWTSPDILEFGYRDSVLRRSTPPKFFVTQVKLKLQPGKAKDIYDRARDYQRQRIGKQPPPASAGSYFKNVTDFELAQKIEGLTEGMRKAGVIPAGFLLEKVDFKGMRLGGAAFHSRHANFMTNIGGATPQDVLALAALAKQAVRERFGVELEAEVLSIGDWS